MRIMPTDKLTDQLLDWAVMKCEHPENSVVFFVHLRERPSTPEDPGHRFRYSTDWSQAGPIIEREKIWLVPLGHVWRAGIRVGPEQGRNVVICGGKTPLVAAMRCHVQHRLGTTVDVPNILLKHMITAEPLSSPA